MVANYSPRGAMLGLIQRTLTKLGNGMPNELRLTEFGDQSVVQTLPPYAELTRGGRRFHGSIASLTGLAPVQAIPTTTATVYLYNADPAKAYLLDYLNAVCVAGTPGAGVILLGLMTKPTSTAPTAGAHYSVNNCSPGSGVRSLAVIAESYTIPAIDTTGANSWRAWVPLVAENTPAAAFLGADASDAFREGRLIIPPGWGLALAFLSAAGTSPLFGVVADWTEIELTLE